MARPVFSNISERTRSPRFQGELFARYLAVADRLKAVAADKNITLLIHPDVRQNADDIKSNCPNPKNP